jgi:hypothetical protein
MAFSGNLGNHRQRRYAFFPPQLHTCKAVDTSTGFGYTFDALNECGTSNELSEAFSEVFSTAQAVSGWRLLRLYFPVLQIIPNERERKQRAARATMDRIGRQLIAEKKRALTAGEKGAGRDLLSLLMQANTDKDLPNSMKMSDDEVLSRESAHISRRGMGRS